MFETLKFQRSLDSFVRYTRKLDNVLSSKEYNKIPPLYRGIMELGRETLRLRKSARDVSGATPEQIRNVMDYAKKAYYIYRNRR